MGLLFLFIVDIGLLLRYLVAAGWFKQWKKYVGFDQWNVESKGCSDAFPGPIDNSPLLQGMM
jgi:ubiquitin carboxyl-terminal hydrolase 4/11/15